MTILSPEERQKAVEALVEHLPEYSQSTDLLIEAVRAAVGGERWVEMETGDRSTCLQETYAHLKKVAGVKLLDDRLTREDREYLEKALKLLSYGQKETDEEAIELIKKALEV